MINRILYKLKNDKVDSSMNLIDRLLVARDILPSQLKVSSHSFHDPYLIKDMDLAVKRIAKAIKNQEKVIIYGDYDTDGISSTVSLKKGLKMLGLDVDYYIPRRLIDGYGININSVFDIIDSDYSLVITVDCGITAMKEVQTFNDFGIDVIITDHHECKEELPKAVAVLDNKRPDNEYPFEGLCGAGMVFKLLSALFEFMGRKGEEKEILKYTTLGTIADVMPLLDENRAIVIEGLNQIKTSQETSIMNLLRAADKLDTREDLTAQDIAFYVAPLINASSRVGDINYALRLLFTKDEEEAVKCADKIKSFNEKRKKIEKEITDNAFEQIVKNYNFSQFTPIVVAGENWHKGVIGIVASRIVDKFHRPAIVLSLEGDAYHGSCRSYADVNIIEMLNYAKETIAQYGGHVGAAGLTVKADMLDSFKKKIAEYMMSKYSNIEDFIPVKEVDIEIKPEELTLDNYEKIQALEPFGQANQEPVFLCKGLKTNVIKRIGQKEGAEGAHLKITFSLPGDNLTTISGISFFQGDYADILPSGKSVDIICKLSKNTWQGKTSLQLMVENIIYFPVYQSGTTVEEDDLYREEAVQIEDIIDEYGVKEEDLIPNKNEYIKVYQALAKMLLETNNKIMITHLHYLTSILSTKTGLELTPFKVSRILDVLEDSNNITYKNLPFDEILISHPDKTKPRIRLSETNTFKKIHKITT